MKNTFGDNLKMLRQFNCLTQTQLAKRLGTTQQRLSEWETGKVEPTLYNLIKLTKVLGVTFEELTENIQV